MQKKVIGLMNDILSGFVGLRAKNYTYLIHGSSEDKNAKDGKRCAIKRNLKFEYFKIVNF